MQTDDLRWVLDVLAAPTVSPHEGGRPGEVAAALKLIADGSLARGFDTAFYHTPEAALADDPDLPTVVRRAAEEGGATFLASQPSLILKIGNTNRPERTIVLNFHVDTVGPHIPPRVVDGSLHGRGTVDDKGPGMAALLGVAHAFTQKPTLREQLGVIVTVVPGEEGGAFGFYGTREVLRRADIRGGLVAFLEPTSQLVVDASSGVMTPEIVVAGRDSTDDCPTQGTNATLILSHAALHLARELSPVAASVKAKLCISGIHTGLTHNRVFGTGELKCNIAYFDEPARLAMEDAVLAAYAALPAAFAAEYGHLSIAQQAASDYRSIVSLRWQKRGIPALQNRHPEWEGRLARAGFPRAVGHPSEIAFTCDAVWGAGRPEYVVILGPGDLGTNGAHTDDEFVELKQLDEFSERIGLLLVQMAAE